MKLLADSSQAITNRVLVNMRATNNRDQVLSLIHAVRQIIRFVRVTHTCTIAQAAHTRDPNFLQSPRTNTALLESVLDSAKQFYLFPSPCGQLARELLIAVSLELKAPGSYKRTLILQENPQIRKGLPSTGRCVRASRFALCF
jgi:hypothetical protein